MKFDPEDTKHTARDYQCPIYQKKLKQYRNQVNYGGNFLRTNKEQNQESKTKAIWN